MIHKLPDDQVPGAAAGGVGRAARAAEPLSPARAAVQIRPSVGPSLRPGAHGPGAQVLPGGPQQLSRGPGDQAGNVGHGGVGVGGSAVPPRSPRRGTIHSKGPSAHASSADRERARTGHALLSGRIELAHLNPEQQQDVLRLTTSLIGSRCAWPDVLQFVARIEAAGIQPNAHTYGALLTRAMQERRPEEALSLFARARRQQVPLNPILCMPAVSALGQLDRAEEALALLRELETTAQPDLRLYDAVMAVFARRDTPEALAQVEQLHAALPARGLTPDARITGTRVMAHARAGRLDRTLALFQPLLAAAAPPHLAVCNAVLGACARVGNAAVALDVFRVMAAQGTEPDIVSFGHLMEACAGDAGRGAEHAHLQASVPPAIRAAIQVGVLQPSVGYDPATGVLSLDAERLLQSGEPWRRAASSLPAVGRAVATYHQAEGRWISPARLQGPPPAVRAAERVLERTPQRSRL